MPKLRVLFISNYQLDYTDYFPQGRMEYNDIEFVTQPDDNIDAVVICNHPTTSVDVQVAKSNIFHVHQEPGDKLYHGFMFNPAIGKKVGHLPLCDINSHPGLNRLVNKTHDQLTSLDTSFENIHQHKTELFSGVISGHNALAGHYFRLKVLEAITAAVDIDLFGKRHNFIPDKWDALFPYQYSLAMENSQQNDYWTEKIMDCYLACTMPVYMGCTNIDKYFPKDSYIALDPNNLEHSIAAMKEKLQGNFFAENYSLVLEARDLCLQKYATAPALSNIVLNNYAKAEKQQCHLKAFKRSPLTDLKRKLTRNRIAHWLADK